MGLSRRIVVNYNGMKNKRTARLNMTVWLLFIAVH